MPPENQGQQNKTETPHNIRTYQSDVEEILKNGQGSLATIAIAENDKKIRAGLSAEEPEKPDHTKFVLALSLGLIIVGVGIFGFIYFWRGTGQKPLPLVEKTPAIIVIDFEKALDIKGMGRNELLSVLAKEFEESTITLSSIVGFRLNEGKGESAQTVLTSDFLKKLQVHAPDSLVRSLAPNFTLGLHALNVNHPFLIFKTNYYQNTYAGMLSWETTLKEDLGPIFIKPEPAMEISTTDQVLGRSETFEDTVVKNRDTRALRNRSGKIVFLYSFPDKNTLIITTNADTLQKISERLLAGKQVR